MAKVLLSMQHNVIPGTPGVTNPIHGNVIVENHPWPERRDGARAARTVCIWICRHERPRRLRRVQKSQTQTIARPIKAGGRHPEGKPCHLVVPSVLSAWLLAGDPQTSTLLSVRLRGTDASCAPPDKRWRFLGEDPAFYKKIGATRDTRGCFVGSVDVDFKSCVAPLVPEDQLIPQHARLSTTTAHCRPPSLRWPLLSLSVSALRWNCIVTVRV